MRSVICGWTVRVLVVSSLMACGGNRLSQEECRARLTEMGLAALDPMQSTQAIQAMSKFVEEHPECGAGGGGVRGGDRCESMREACERRAHEVVRTNQQGGITGGRVNGYVPDCNAEYRQCKMF